MRAKRMFGSLNLRTLAKEEASILLTILMTSTSMKLVLYRSISQTLYWLMDTSLISVSTSSSQATNR